MLNCREKNFSKDFGVFFQNKFVLEFILYQFNLSNNIGTYDEESIWIVYNNSQMKIV